MNVRRCTAVKNRTRRAKKKKKQLIETTAECTYYYRNGRATANTAILLKYYQRRCTAAIIRTDFRLRTKPVWFLMHPKTGADRLGTRFPRNTCLRNDKIFTTRLTAAAGARVSNGIIYNEPKKVLILLFGFFFYCYVCRNGNRFVRNQPRRVVYTPIRTSHVVLCHP